jgi:transposase InsO family protein
VKQFFSSRVPRASSWNSALRIFGNDFFRHPGKVLYAMLPVSFELGLWKSPERALVCQSTRYEAKDREDWRQKNNTFKPHNFLGNLIPEEFASKHQKEGKLATGALESTG